MKINWARKGKPLSRALGLLLSAALCSQLMAPVYGEEEEQAGYLQEEESFDESEDASHGEKEPEEIEETEEREEKGTEEETLPILPVPEGEEEPASLIQGAFGAPPSPYAPRISGIEVSTIAELEHQLSSRPGDSDYCETIILSADFPNPLDKTVTAAIYSSPIITIYSQQPITLYPNGRDRHFNFEIEEGRTLTLNLVNITLDGNGAGGGIRANGTGTFELAGGTVTNCASEEGGGIYSSSNIYSGSNLVISGNAQISGNSAYSSGGGIFALGAVEIRDSAQISGNFAEHNGGGICAYEAVKIRDSAQISGNSAAGYGGGIYAYDTAEIKDNALISDNYAGYGGGIYAYDTAEIKDNALISDNYASYSGGGIYAEKTIEIKDNTQISSNSAGDKGGGIYALGDVEIKDYAQISGNSADYSSGGGIYALGDVIISGDALIPDNSANFDGGGIYAGGDVEIKDNALISDNSASYKGGGIYALGDVIISGDALISGNSTSNYGGGIWLLDLDNLTMSGGSFNDNFAGEGGITFDDYDSFPSSWADIPATIPFDHVINNFDVCANNLPSNIESTRHFAVFKRNDGTNDNEARVEIISPNAPLDTFPQDPVRDGYTFTKWTESADGTGEVITEDTLFSGNISHLIYAQWKEDGFLGGGNPGGEKPGGNLPGDNNRPDSYREEREPKETGILAVYIYRITFDTKGGSEIPFLRVKASNSANAPEEPAKEGFVFTGWFTDEGCTKPYDFNKPVTGSFILYAGWEEEILPETITEPVSTQNPVSKGKKRNWFYIGTQK